MDPSFRWDDSYITVESCNIMRKSRKTHQEKIYYWFPRISAIMFVIISYFFIFTDFQKLIAYYPLALEFILGTAVLTAILVAWNDGKTGGTVFILLGLIFALVSVHRLLVISILFSTIWLVLTGALMLLDHYSADQKRKKARVYARKFTAEH